MAALCGGDPLICIDFTVLFIAEFLKDWTTIVMLLMLLGFLLRLRADRQCARDADYARQLEAYDDKRGKKMRTLTWVIEEGRIEEP